MMRRAQSLFVLPTIFAALAASFLGAQSSIRFGATPPTTDLTPSQRTFAEAYVTAITGSDIERYKRLLHPTTRACMNKDNADYFNTIFKRRVGQVATNPRLSVETLPEKLDMFDALRARGWSWAVRPTHAFHIDAVSSGTKESMIAAFAVFDNGAWYEVLPCPSPKALDDMRQIQQRNEAAAVKARELAASIKDPLRAELLALLKKGSQIGAAKRYAEAAHVDLTLAWGVVKALEQEQR